MLMDSSDSAAFPGLHDSLKFRLCAHTRHDFYGTYSLCFPKFTAARAWTGALLFNYDSIIHHIPRHRVLEGRRRRRYVIGGQRHLFLFPFFFSLYYSALSTEHFRKRSSDKR